MLKDRIIYSSSGFWQFEEVSDKRHSPGRCDLSTMVRGTDYLLPKLNFGKTNYVFREFSFH